LPSSWGSAPASLILFVLGYMSGLSVTKAAVFGSYALLTGLFADYVIRAKFN